jgi:6,7-dimethyl-8-ribityllumazine synthase
VKEIEGRLVPNAKARFALVVGRFNSFITERLLEGAVDCLTRHGVKDSQIVVARVPGSWEIPVAAQRFAETGKYTAIIGIGAVIRGSTAHFEHVSGEAAKGLAQVALQTGVPVLNAVLATDNLEQAIERAGSKQGNKGWDAALAALEMTDLFSQDFAGGK